jgi:serine/threonine protein kinase
MPAKEPARNPIEHHRVYEKIKFINSGSFGYVILARNKITGENVAIKFVEVNSEKDVKHRYARDDLRLSLPSDCRPFVRRCELYPYSSFYRLCECGIVLVTRCSGAASTLF